MNGCIRLRTATHKCIHLSLNEMYSTRCSLEKYANCCVHSCVCYYSMKSDSKLYPPVALTRKSATNCKQRLALTTM